MHGHQSNVTPAQSKRPEEIQKRVREHTRPQGRWKVVQQFHGEGVICLVNFPRGQSPDPPSDHTHKNKTQRDHMFEYRNKTPQESNVNIRIRMRWLRVALFIIAPEWQQPTRPSIGARRNKLWSIHAMDYDSAIRWDKRLIDMTWTSLQLSQLSKSK